MTSIFDFIILIFLFIISFVFIFGICYFIYKITKTFLNYILLKILDLKYKKWINKRPKNCEKNECPICMEEGYLMTSECKHNICNSCWITIVKRYNSCPYCRQKVDLSKLKYIKG